MEITKNAWNSYIDKLSRLNQTATDKIKVYIDQHGLPETDEEMSVFLGYAYSLSTKYGEGAAALACEMYDAVASASGMILPPAEPADTATYGEVARALRGTMKISQNTNYISGVLGKTVKQAGADTTLKNALRDGAQFAWVPNGDTCAFCLTLASKGWQYASKNAIKNGHAEHIHANCDCTYAIRFDEQTNVAGYDPAEYLRIYESAEGRTSEEKINAIRRRYYAQNKEAINMQKRAAYAENKTNNDLSVREKELKKIKEEARKKGEKYVDVTQTWKSYKFDGNSVEDATTCIIDGVSKEIDGKRIVLDYDEKEKLTAELLVKNLGGKIIMNPKIYDPQGQRCADYDYNGIPFDRKGPVGASKNTIDNQIKAAKGQANNVVIDLSECMLNEQEVLEQVKRVFSSPHREYLETLILTKDNLVMYIFERT